MGTTRQLLHPLRAARRRHDDILRLQYDTRALAMLPRDLTSHVPWTGASLRPGAVLVALNDVVSQEKQVVVELGAGVSTIYLAHALAQVGGHLWSVEHDDRWAAVVGRILEREGLAEHVTFVVCPLESTDGWYDRAVLARGLPEQSIDLLLIDGPPSGGKGAADARYPALPMLQPHLSPAATVILDDATRPGEAAVLARWEAEFDYRFKVRAISCDAAVGRRSTDWTL